MANGIPLLFIHPNERATQVWITVGQAAKHDLEFGRLGRELVGVIDTVTGAKMERHPLSAFSADSFRGISSPRLRELADATAQLREFNAHGPKQAEEVRACRAAERAENERDRHRRREEAQRPRQQGIRDALRDAAAEPGRWADSEAITLVRGYFEEFCIDKRGYDPRRYPAAGTQLWQSVIYFELIAGRERAFSVDDAQRVLERYGIALPEGGQAKLIGYLDWISDFSFLETPVGRVVEALNGSSRFYQPTYAGAWQ